MAEYKLQGIKIDGIACAVPAHKVDNTEFYKKFGSDKVDKIIQMTGVKHSYRTEEEQTASDLCYIAAKELLEKKNITPEDIGVCVFISQTPDYRQPATACVLHKRLGLKKNCMAFDVSLGCSGWVYGVNIVGSLMLSSNVDKAIMLFGDTCIKTTSPEDHSSVLLFGEAGSATLLTKDANSEISGELMTDGEGYKAIIIPSGAYRNRNGKRERELWGDGIVRSDYEAIMNGTDVFSFTLTQVPKMIKHYMSNVYGNSGGYSQFDALILHQANLYILEQMAKKLKVSMDMIPVSLDRFGNTSGASIPLTICDRWGNDKESGELHLFMCGFGIGLSWGIVDTIIDKKSVFPIVFSDEYYKEGGVAHE